MTENIAEKVMEISPNDQMSIAILFMVNAPEDVSIWDPNIEWGHHLCELHGQSVTSHVPTRKKEYGRREERKIKRSGGCHP